jgi:pyridoxal 5'-phosphate synthase pdxT subunit
VGHVGAAPAPDVAAPATGGPGATPPGGAKVGVLSLQGASRDHARALADLGAHPVEVRGPDDLAAIDGIIVPGGESTTISMLLASSGLTGPLGELLRDGLPALGTCAGMILLGAEILGGRPDQEPFGVIDLSVRRNGFGRQVDSFEADLDVADLPGGPFPGVFIRAPVVERVGASVEVLATVGDRAVLCRQGPVLVASFHPELSGDLRLHQRFLHLVTDNRRKV